MRTTLVILWGATSTGKTDIAISLSQNTSSPVISLDRIQCIPELATGSGRPPSIDLRGTRRIYLANRKLSEGVISATEANCLLKKHVSEFATEHSQLILEGGSVSLLNEIISDPYWKEGFNWLSHKFQLGDRTTFLKRASSRVREMFYPSDDSLSLLDELALGWSTPAHRPILEGIVGYRAAILFARVRELAVSELPGMNTQLKDDLIEEITNEYLTHAIWQEENFLPSPSTWGDFYTSISVKDLNMSSIRESY